MESHGMEFKGPINVQKISTLSTWTSTDEGRVVYAEDVNIFYFGNNTEWVSISGGGAVKSVQRGIASSSSALTISAVDVNKTMCTVLGVGTAGSATNGRIELTSSTVLTISLIGIPISWEVVEFY